MSRVDPYKNFKFIVEIDGIVHAGFSECSGLESRVEVIEYREGNEPETSVRKLPGRASYSNIVLKRGLTDSRELYDWHRTAIRGPVDRKNGSIILLDDAGESKVRWNFRNGWPARWEGPLLNARGNAVAIETLEIAHEGLELAS